jgi:hypothetical protein
VWHGRSVDRDPNATLGPYLSRAVSFAKTRGGSVEMRFESVQHVNSATVTAIIQGIQVARSLGVKLVVVYDQELKWQRIGFGALQLFVKGDGLLELRGGGRAA